MLSLGCNTAHTSLNIHLEICKLSYVKSFTPRELHFIFLSITGLFSNITAHQITCTHPSVHQRHQENW